jgi:diadenosine tetraphosphate (Ap4A) HIT family hydrolase
VEHGSPSPIECPFCERVRSAARGASPLAFDDGMPVTPGHRLVVPASHVELIEDLSDNEWDELFGLVREEARALSSAADVDGVNIGVNSGRAAGQTVGHAHVHLIPRRDGDVEDPRGGVRWVLPTRAAYWEGP